MLVVYLWFCRLFKSDNKDLNPRKIYKLQTPCHQSKFKKLLNSEQKHFFNSTQKLAGENMIND